MPTPIRKAVFPVAGLGTRFLPATKAIPKEMLPIVDKPLIQYAVEEAVEAGAETLIFVTGRTKSAIADHFDHAVELEAELEAAGKQDMLDLVQGVVPASVSCAYVRQPRALGLGHAVLCARPLVGDAPFYVLLPDDLIRADPGCLTQMRGLYERTGASVVAVQDVAREDTGRYGIAATGAFDGDSGPITGLVEKPAPSEAPSTLAVVGRYVLTPRVFDLLAKVTRGAGGEIQLTDAIAALLGDEAVHAFRYRGERYDCGSKIGFLKATVDYGRAHPETGSAFAAWIKENIK